MSSFWLILKQQWTIKISSPLFSIFSLATILVGSRDHQTQFWKGAIQGPFHQSFVQIGPVASEELIKMWKVNGRTDNRRRTLSGDNSSKFIKKKKKILHYVYIYVVSYISINSTFIWCIYWFVTCWNLKKKKKKSVKNICSIGHNVKLVQA